MNRICIMDMFYVPKFQANLLSVSNFLSNGLKVQIHVNECIVGSVNNNVIAMAQREGNLNQITSTEVYGANAANFVCSRGEGNPTKL